MPFTLIKLEFTSMVVFQIINLLDVGLQLVCSYLDNIHTDTVSSNPPCPLHGLASLHRDSNQKRMCCKSSHNLPSWCLELKVINVSCKFQLMFKQDNNYWIYFTCSVIQNWTAIMCSSKDGMINYFSRLKLANIILCQLFGKIKIKMKLLHAKAIYFLDYFGTFYYKYLS